MRGKFIFKYAVFVTCVIAGSQNNYAQANTNRDVERIIVQVRDDSGESIRTLSDLGSTLNVENFEMNHPHKIVNPKNVVLSFSGLSLKRILDFPQRNISKPRNLSGLSLSIVGRDGYTVAMPLSDALEAQAVIVSHEGAKRLGWRKGGPFLAFRSLKTISDLAESSWWGWWVSAILVGEPLPSLTVAGKKLDERALATHCSTKEKGILNYPRGRRKAEPPRITSGELAVCKLSDLLNRVGKKPDAKKKYVAEFLTGQTLILDDVSAFRVVRSFNGANISAELGGPLQLCETTGKKECRYFLTSLLESL